MKKYLFAAVLLGLATISVSGLGPCFGQDGPAPCAPVAAPACDATTLYPAPVYAPDGVSPCSPVCDAEPVATPPAPPVVCEGGVCRIEIGVSASAPAPTFERVRTVEKIRVRDVRERRGGCCLRDKIGKFQSVLKRREKSRVRLDVAAPVAPCGPVAAPVVEPCGPIQ